jgi:hypothetical protein
MKNVSLMTKRLNRDAEMADTKDLNAAGFAMGQVFQC